MELILEVMGWIGAAAVVSGYALVSLKRVQPDGWRYQGLNIGGSLLLAIYAAWHGAMASVAVNVIWLGIGIFTVFAVARARTLR